MNYPQALYRLGLPDGTKSEDALLVLKEKIIAARRSPLGENHPDLPNLTALKSVIQKRVYPKCEVCGVSVSHRDGSYKVDPDTPFRCSVHQTRNNCMNAELRLESGYEIPKPQRTCGISPVRAKVRLLLQQGKVGDSFTAYAPIKSGVGYINSTAAKDGLKTITRIIFPHRADPERKGWALFRCWRSDGLSMEEVNAVIQRRAKLPKETT